MKAADKAKVKAVFAREQCTKCAHVRLYKQLNPDAADKTMNILDGCPFECKAIEYYYTFIDNQKLLPKAHRNVVDYGGVVPECFQDNLNAIIEYRKLTSNKVAQICDADSDHLRRQLKKQCGIRETVAMRYCKKLMLPYEFMLEPHDPEAIVEELKQYELRK